MSEMEIRDIIVELEELVGHAEEALRYYNQMCDRLPPRRLTELLSPGLNDAISNLKYSNRNVRHGLNDLLYEIEHGVPDEDDEDS
jgi:hypothetical protein